MRSSEEHEKAKCKYRIVEKKEAGKCVLVSMPLRLAFSF